MDNFRVELGSRSYDVVIGNGLLNRTGELIAPIVTTKQQLVIITDENVAQLHLKSLERALTNSNYRFETIILAAGEQSKSFAVLEKTLNAILDLKPDRKTTLIALGGGVVGDLTGFVASILLRGVPFIQIPTTFLAQVDSSVGGKTGINTKHGKNLVGSFYQPRIVIADSSMLNTLSEREYLAGYAEVIKYALINDLTLFEWATANEDYIKKRDATTIRKCVTASCKNKSTIVARDEREGGVRALLNLGHTFGHALEAETGFSNELLHGEAVAIGMVMAFTLSVHLGYCAAGDLNRVVQHLKAIGLPISPLEIRKEWNNKKLISHMYGDKKAENGKLTFVLVRAIGKSFIAKDVEESAVMNMLNAMNRIS